MALQKKFVGKLEPMGFCGDGSAFEESLAVPKSSKADRKFDTTVGHIEDIIMDEKFQKLQNDFLERHYQVFDDVEENKLIYTEIHREYTLLIENFLENELYQRMPGFSMVDFQKQLMSRRKELDGEVFEVLLTFSDFLAFKDLVLGYKAAKEGHSLNLGDGLTVLQLKLLPTSAATEMHIDTTYSPQLNLTETSEGTIMESMHFGQSGYDDPAISCPLQGLSIQGNSNLGLCISGSGIKSARK